MTVRAGRSDMATLHGPVVAAFRMGAVATVFIVLSACEQGTTPTQSGATAGRQVTSPRDASASRERHQPLIGIEPWVEFEPAAGAALTHGDMERSASMVSKCWDVPVDEIDPRDSAVRLKLSMNRDGTVQRLEVLDPEKLADSPSFRALAESAVKAIMKCMPLNLPADKYDQWKVFVLYFDAGPLVQR